MSPAAHGNRNRSVHRAVVDLVGAYFDAEGIDTVVKRTPKSISESLSEDVIVPDLALDGADLRVSSRLRPFRLSEDLESVTRGAALRGVDVAAVIQWRSERDIADSFAVLSLRDFSRLIRAAGRT